MAATARTLKTAHIGARYTLKRISQVTQAGRPAVRPAPAAVSRLCRITSANQIHDARHDFDEAVIVLPEPAKQLDLVLRNELQAMITYRLTWPELVRLYRLTLDTPARDTQPRYSICPTTNIDVDQRKPTPEHVPASCAFTGEIALRGALPLPGSQPSSLAESPDGSPSSS